MSTDADSSASSDHADTSRGHHLRVVEGCMLALVFIVVAVRLYSRKRFLGRIFCDDICILLSTALLIIIIALHTVMTHYGFGQHSAGLPASWIRKQMLMGDTSRCLYPPASTLIRMSVIGFVRRLSPHSWIYYSTIILLILNFLFTILSILFIVFQCSPRTATFQSPLMRSLTTPCIDFHAVAFGIPLASVALDLCVWLLPVVLVLRVQLLDWRKKAIAIGLLGMGLFACIAGAMRLPLSRSREYTTDPGWTAVWMALWTSVEIAMGIVTASVPALAPLLMHCAKKASDGGRLPSFLPLGFPAPPPTLPVAADLEAQLEHRKDDKPAASCPIEAQIEIEMRKYQSTEMLWRGGVDGVECSWRRERGAGGPGVVVVQGDEEEEESVRMFGEEADSIKRLGDDDAVKGS